VRQFQKIMSMDGVDRTFTKEAPAVYAASAIGLERYAMEGAFSEPIDFAVKRTGSRR